MAPLELIRSVRALRAVDVHGQRPVGCSPSVGARVTRVTTHQRGHSTGKWAVGNEPGSAGRVPARARDRDVRRRRRAEVSTVFRRCSGRPEPYRRRERSRRVPGVEVSQQGNAARRRETRRIAWLRLWSSRRCTRAVVSCADRAASRHRLRLAARARRLFCRQSVSGSLCRAPAHLSLTLGTGKVAVTTSVSPSVFSRAPVSQR